MGRFGRGGRRCVVGVCRGMGVHRKSASFTSLRLSQCSWLATCAAYPKGMALTNLTLPLDPTVMEGLASKTSPDSTKYMHIFPPMFTDILSSCISVLC